MRDQQNEKLRLGKGRSYFVKSQLKRLRQEDDIWEADFFPVPQQGVWIGLVISHTDDFVLAHQKIREAADRQRSRPIARRGHAASAGRVLPPTTNALHARKARMGRASAALEASRHRGRVQDKLPKWDDAFGDLYAQVERNEPAEKT